MALFNQRVGERSSPTASLEALQEINTICNDIALSQPALEALFELPNLASQFNQTNSAPSIAMLEFVTQQKYETLGMVDFSVATEGIIDFALKAVMAPINFVGNVFSGIIKSEKSNQGPNADNPLESAYAFFVSGKYAAHPSPPKSFVERIEHIGDDSVKLNLLKSETKSRLEIYSDIEYFTEYADFLDIERYLKGLEDIKKLIVSNQGQITPQTLSKINELTKKLLIVANELTLTVKSQNHYGVLVDRCKLMLTDFKIDFEKNIDSFKELHKAIECFFEEFGSQMAVENDINVVSHIQDAIFNVLSLRDGDYDDKYTHECVVRAIKSIENLKKFNSTNAMHLNRIEKALSKIN